MRVKVVKNKIAPPFRKAEMDIMFGKGISAVGSLLEAALQNNLVEKAGSWYSYGKERIGQGVENARLFLESNPAVYAELEKKVRGALFPQKGQGAGQDAKPTAAAEPAARPAPAPARPRTEPPQATEGEEPVGEDRADSDKELF